MTLHGVNPNYMFQTYKGERSVLAHAHDFEVTADTPANALELIWMLTNVGDDQELNALRPDLGHYGDQVQAYRSRRNRSLSVGDVVLIYDGDDYVGGYAVEPFGWTDLARRPPVAFGGTNGSVVSASYLAMSDAIEEYNSGRH